MDSTHHVSVLELSWRLLLYMYHFWCPICATNSKHEGTINQARIPAAVSVEAIASRRLCLAILGYPWRRKIVITALVKADVRHIRKAWKKEGLSLNRTVGTGLPPTYSSGSCRIPKTVRNAIPKISSSRGAAGINVIKVLPIF